MGNNPSPPQQAGRASSEGRSATGGGLAGHGHDQSGGGYGGHPFQHMLHQHSGWNGGVGQDMGGAGPITGGVGTGSASSLASSSSNEGLSLSQTQPGGTGGSAAGHSGGSYHADTKYKYDRLNEADANADNRQDLLLLPN